jgi:hypothetical protein
MDFAIASPVRELVIGFLAGHHYAAWRGLAAGRPHHPARHAPIRPATPRRPATVTLKIPLMAWRIGLHGKISGSK